ncbi:MAG: gliding motility-associated ABC transporter substrate-binding protein GldG [Salibacteraceae bacterium]
MVKPTKDRLPNKRMRKWVELFWLISIIASVVLLNVLGAYVFGRFDLTEEKRYTLSETTRNMLEELDDVVFVRVYLEGDLPAEFRELRDAVKETLDEFRAYAGDNLQYEFINPGASPVESERMQVYAELSKQGLQYTTVRIQSGDKHAEQIIFPGAIVAFRERETPVQLLKNQMGVSEQELIAISIQQLEYELLSAIKKVSETEKKSIAFIDGYGSLEPIEVADVEQALSEFYDVEHIKINSRLDALKLTDAIIIARPDSAFSEKDKFIIDQFIMRGGKVLWMIDAVFARMDSLQKSNITMGLVLDHNLDDQLFKYGVRLNPNLIMDLEALPIPIVTGYIGNRPRQEMFTWYYSPLLQPIDTNPITKNLDRIKTEFVSSIDPIEVEGVKFTPLLVSSDKSRTVNAPTRISFNILREPPRYELFNQGPFVAAALLEGSFQSVFTNRLPQKLISDEGINFKEKSLIPTRMIVVADGDIIRNPVRRSENRYFSLGYDKWTNRVYGNKEFILNCINYLFDDAGLINVRNKEFKIRLLDQTRIATERYYWQILNTVLPIVIVIGVGLALNAVRRKKYVY